jgi:hypothetical protein
VSSNNHDELGIVVHAIIPALRAKAEGSKVQGQPGLHSKTLSKVF